MLIAGCGDVGIRLGLELTRLGNQVFGLRRNIRNLPPEITPLQADVSSPASLVHLPPEIDIVVYCAAATEGTEEAYEKAYVEGPRNLLGALRGNLRPESRILFTSSTSVYGQKNGEWVDEKSATEPTSFRGEIVRKGEEVFLNGTHQAIVVRLAGIYGPGRTALINKVSSGAGIFSEDPPVYTNRIHSQDAALLLAHLSRLPAPDSIYVGVDDEPAPRHEVHRWVASILGVAFQPGSLPSGSPSIFGSKRCRNRRIKNRGYSFQYPSYREGYGELLADGS